MEMREWALQILSSERLEDKLYSPVLLTDFTPGSPLFWKDPARSPAMELKKRSKEEKLPAFQELGDAQKRAVCLHRFGGHELLAVEIMAYALLAFPDAPPTFRKGLANTLKEEQGHVRLYMHEMERLGIQFGDLPFYKHFWLHTHYMITPLHYVSIMSLTFEMANLDFAPLYGKAFLKHGDAEAAQLMAQITKDEISHVGFGWRWLKNFKQNDISEWEEWTKTLCSTLITPKRAKGFVLHADNRKAAGIPETWIASLKEY